MSEAKNPKELVPSLRFPEFRATDAWKFRPLQAVGSRVTDRNGDESITRVLTNSAEHGVLDQRDFFEKDIAVAGRLDNYFIVEIGDYVYNPRISRTAPVGPISRNNVGQGIVSPLYTVFRLGEDGTDFHEHYFATNGWHNYLRSVSSTGARHDRMNIGIVDFMKMPIPLPTPAEQRKIAECLGSLDDWIAAETEALATLRRHKTGLMQQLFPRPGETRPRLRFREFQSAGEWEPVRLSKLGKLVSGLTYSPDDVRDFGLLVLRSSNVQHGRISLDDCVYVRPDVKGANQVNADDILICVRNGSKSLIGKNALIPRGIPKCTHGAFMTIFRAKEPRFTYYLFQTSAYQTQVLADLGATINSINGKQLLRYKFRVPKPAEQHRIADCLISLDTLIASQGSKLAALRRHKRGLMQQLFPAPDDRAGGLP